MSQGQTASGKVGMRLSVGATPGCRLLALLAAIPMVAVLVIAVAITIFEILPALIEDGVDGVWSALVTLFGLVVPGFTIYAVAAIGWLFFGIFRTGTWLKGYFLVERRVVRSVRADLRTARVELRDADTKGVTKVLLVVTEPETGKSQEVTIEQGGITLPSDQLHAIANAIVEGRQRVAAGDRSFAVADRLRHLATSV